MVPYEISDIKIYELLLLTLSVDHARGVAAAAIRVNFERIYSSSRMVVVVPPHWLKVN